MNKYEKKIKGISTVKNVLNNVLESRTSLKSNEGYIIWKLKKNWQDIVSEVISESTEPKRLKNGELTINVSDSSIYHSIIIHQNVIIEKINDFFKRKLVIKLNINKINKKIRRNLIDNFNENKNEKKNIYEIKENKNNFYIKEDEIIYNSKEIEITKDELKKIEDNIQKIDKKYSDFAKKLYKIAINKKKKDKYLLTKGYIKCNNCNQIFFPKKEEKICFVCFSEKENEKEQIMANIIKNNPYISEKEATIKAKTDSYVYYKIRDILAQKVYFEILYFCEKKVVEIEAESDYTKEIKNEAKIDFEILIKNYIDYKVGSNNKEVYEIERKRVLRKLKNEMYFRKNKSIR